MVTKIIAVDSASTDYYAREHYKMPYFPIDQFQKIVSGADDKVDVIETLATAIRKIPDNDSPEAVANAYEQHFNKA